LLLNQFAEPVAGGNGGCGLIGGFWSIHTFLLFAPCLSLPLGVQPRVRMITMKTPTERWANLIAFLCLIAFGSGCAHPIAGIVGPGANRATLVYSYSQTHPSLLLGVDEHTRTFRYLGIDPKEFQYQLRTFDFSGRLLSEIPFPKFSTYYLYHFSSHSGFAVSPDCMSVAYLDLQENNEYDQSTKDLVWFDARTGARKVLVKNLARIWNSIRLLCWVSNTELLVAMDEYYQPEGRLLLVNVEKQEVIFELHPKHTYSPQFSLSHSRRYLAYWESGAFKIFDLREKRELAATAPGKLSVHARPRWAPDDSELLYVMDDKLMVFSMGSEQSEVLRVFGPNFYILLHGYQGDHVYYTIVGGTKARSPVKLRRFDVTTQQEMQFPSHPEGPFHVFVCKDETLIYYLLGCEPF
jgi:hypothetical protein